MPYEDSGCIHAVPVQVDWLIHTVHELKPFLSPAILWSVPVLSVRNNVKPVLQPGRTLCHEIPIERLHPVFTNW